MSKNLGRDELEQVNRTELTPLLYLERSEKVFPKRIASVYGGRRFTYAEMASRARKLATALASNGLKRGDRVAVLAPNVPAILEAHFGVPMAGGVLVAINTRLNAEEISYILDHSGARILFVDAELATVLEPAKDSLKTVELVVTIEDPEFAPDQRRVFDGSGVRGVHRRRG